MGNDLQSYAKTLLFRENKLRLGIKLIYPIKTYIMKEKIRIETLPHIEIWVYLYNNCIYLLLVPFLRSDGGGNRLSTCKCSNPESMC